MRTAESDRLFYAAQNKSIPERVTDRAFNPKSVAALNEITAYTGANIIVSSSWRLTYDTMQLKAIFKANGVHGKVIGCTDVLHYRGEEILDWLDRDAVEKYVVIDDNTKDILPYLNSKLVITCDPTIGLTEPLVDQIIELLL